MKKLFTLVSAALLAVSMSATTFTFSAQSDTAQTKDGITVKLAKGTGQNNPAWVSSSSQLRLYANNTITITGDSIGSAAITFSKGAKAYASLTASAGTLVSGGSSTSSDNKVIDNWTGDALKEVVFTLGATGQRAIYKLVVNGGGEGGDTTMIEDVDGLEIDFYPSYSEEGAYDYTFLLYNSEDENNLPMIAFDILTEEEKVYTGTYSVKEGTLTEYSYYVYGSEDEDYLEFTDGEITITDNGKDNYTIKGWFTDGEEVYGVDVTLDGEYFNAEYAYEPEEKTTLNLTITAGEVDDSYAESYGIIDIYLTTADGQIQLEYYLPAEATELEDGTYTIEAAEYDEEDALIQTYGFFDAGYYYSNYGMPVASYYETEEEYYYLVSGTVKIETTEEGKKVTLAGTTYYGSTINAEYTIVTTGTEQINSEKVINKRVENNQVVIIRNNEKFNVIGQRIL